MRFARLAALAIIVLILLTAPFAAEAQPGSKVYRVGYLGGFGVDDTLRQELRARGYVEGQNLVIEGRFHQGKIDRYPALVADLVSLSVDVIVCATTVGTAAAKKGTPTIPIVMAGAANPIAAGLISSLARPGGNVTGVILETADITAKRVELLKESLPGLRRLAAFYGGSRAEGPAYLNGRAQLATLAAKYRLPMMFPSRIRPERAV